MNPDNDDKSPDQTIETEDPLTPPEMEESQTRRVEWVRISDLPLRTGGSVLARGSASGDHIQAVIHGNIADQSLRMREVLSARQRDLDQALHPSIHPNSLARGALTLTL